MFVKSDSIKRDGLVEADICIVGAGAAGISIALEFGESERKICVLESGDFERDDLLQSLYDFETSDLPISRDSRVRRFGGTTTVWQGLWRPHEEADFEKREWVKNSGWPINYNELAPYYDRAGKAFNAPLLSDFDLPPNGGLFETDELKKVILYKIDSKDWDLGKKNRNYFENSKNTSIYLGANVTSIEANTEVSKIEHVEVKTIKGNRFRVKAKVYILATGGIENARLLLFSQSKNKAGLGNEHDQVGRYYMDHPKGVFGKVKMAKPVSWPYASRLKGMDFDSYAGVGLTKSSQKQYSCLNSYAMLEPVEMSIYSRLSRKFFGSQPRVSVFLLRNFMEQEPLESNRVYLSGKKDKLGCLTVKINWSISEREKNSLKVLHRLLDQDLRAKRIGSLESGLLDEKLDHWPITKDASHHMGTTRMGADPKSSVVDSDCKVHSLENLYVSGSSVFSTAGYANPNATIIALAIRLADHIKAEY